MKLTIPRSSLLDALQRVQNVVSTRSTLPILANVLVDGTAEGLFLSTTDLEVSVRCQVQATIEKSGATTLPVRRLSSIVRELPDKDVTIESDDSHAAEIRCESSYFKINGISAEEFPRQIRPEGKSSYRVEQSVFAEMLRKTAYAASTDETRYVLNGVLLSFKGGKLTMVATDGRRLALVEHEVEFPQDSECDVIVPSKAVSELMHTLKDEGELRIQVGQNQIVFEYGNVMLCSKLVEGTYPNFRQVIPAQCEERITIERESLLIAMKRVSLLTVDRTSAAKLVFGKNKLTVSAMVNDVGQVKETVPIKYSGKDIKVAFNPEYMMDALRNLENDEVSIELTDELSPGVIKCDIPFLYVLMPMRISE